MRQARQVYRRLRGGRRQSGGHPPRKEIDCLEFQAKQKKSALDNFYVPLNRWPKLSGDRCKDKCKSYYSDDVKPVLQALQCAARCDAPSCTAGYTQSLDKEDTRRFNRSMACGAVCAYPGKSDEVWLLSCDANFDCRHLNRCARDCGKSAKAPASCTQACSNKFGLGIRLCKRVQACRAALRAR